MVSKNFLDYPGLQEYDALIKEYSDDADSALDTRLQAIEGAVQGIDITVSGSTLLIGYVYDEHGMKVDFTFSGSSLVVG